MFLGMGAFKPAGILTDALRAEWKQTCQRIASPRRKCRVQWRSGDDRAGTAVLPGGEGAARSSPAEVVDLD